jgi:hypothetical protein
VIRQLATHFGLPSGMPARVNAIVMLAGPGDRLDLALRLARERRAPFLVICRENMGYGSPCPKPVHEVKLICFEPVPAWTRGEAEFTAWLNLARKYNWRSVALVTNIAQDFRARQRMERCAGRACDSFPVPQWRNCRCRGRLTASGTEV